MDGSSRNMEDEGARGQMLVSGKDRDETVLAAWLYHVGGQSQEEIGQALKVSRFRVNRMLAEARDSGIIRVTVEHETTGTLRLADTLRRQWGLSEVLVAPVPDRVAGDGDYARRAVGMVAAGFLQRVGSVTDGTPRSIGVGWGRTVASMAQALNGLRNPNLSFVSLMGSMVRTSETSPFDVCARLAALTGGQAIFMPAPFLADSVDDCALILRQRLVQESLDAARRVDHAIISVGECTPEAFIFSSGVLTSEDGLALHSAGVVADTTGKFFRKDGTLAQTELNHRAPSVAIEDLNRCDVALLAAGASKLMATQAILRAGFVNRLIVDETLARLLLNQGDRQEGLLFI